MATIIVIRNKETGQERALYSALAREILGGPNAGNWEFVRRLDRTARMVEGSAAAAVRGGEAGAVEFHGEASVQADARKAVEPPAPGVVATKKALSGESDAVSGQDAPQAPRGSRGGGKQEPAKASADDK